jgi:hypothetical protein
MADSNASLSSVTSRSRCSGCRRKKMVSAQGRRQQVECAHKRGLSCRRACALIRAAHSSLRYESRLEKKYAPVTARMCELAAQYPRDGYRRVRTFLGRVRDSRWRPTPRTGAGVAQGFKFLIGGHGGALPRAVLGLCHRRGRTTSGPTTSCSTLRQLPRNATTVGA